MTQAYPKNENTIVSVQQPFNLKLMCAPPTRRKGIIKRVALSKNKIGRRNLKKHQILPRVQRHV